MISILVPEQKPSSLENLRAHLNAAPGRMPFDELGMRFVGELSRRVLTDPACRARPDLLSMAHWFRAAHIEDLAQRLRRSDDASASCSVPRGIVFHVAPANIDAIFAYSWLLSLLAGNANVIRLSKKSIDGTAPLIKIFNRLLQHPEYEALRSTNLAISYEHDEQVTSAISAACHSRVIWGGDQTVRSIRAIPLNPLANEIAFANRFSLCAMNVRAILEASDDALVQVVSGFYNDTFWYGQQACSSPRAVVWVGSPADGGDARHRFWTAFQRHLSDKDLDDTASYAMDRATTASLYAAVHAQSHFETTVSGLPSRVLIDSLDNQDRDRHCGHGLFVEMYRDSLSDIVPLLRAKDQTMIHFGFSRAVLHELLPRLPPRSIDRIVPVGAALAFSTNWDGQDLLRCLTRQVEIQERL